MSLPPVEIPLGAMRFNSDSSKLEYWMGSAWMQIQTFSPNLDGGARAVFHSGRTSSGSDVNVIDYITISTQGNAIDFGDSTQSTEANNLSTISSRTRALYGGGYKHPSGHHDQIGFITFSSTGNSTDFGDISSARGGGGAGCTPTRGILAGGRYSTPSGNENTIDMITIATTGNATDFGDITQARAYSPSGASDSHGGLS